MPTIEKRFTTPNANDNFAAAFQATPTRTFDIYPTGVVATDTATWGLAVDRVNAVTDGANIRIIDNAQPFVTSGALASPKTILNSCRIYGETKSSRWNMISDFEWSFGGYEIPYYQTGLASYYSDIGTFTAVVVDADFITGVTGISLNVNDWVILFSQNDADVIPETAPHVTNGFNHVAEIYQIKRIIGARHYLDRPILHAIATAPMIRRVDLVKNWGLHNLTIDRSGGTIDLGVQHRYCKVQRSKSFIFEDIHYISAPGHIEFHGAVNTRFDGVTDESMASKGDYGVAVGLSYNFKMNDCYYQFPQHAFATGAQNGANGSGWELHYWGTCEFARIVNCHSTLLTDSLYGSGGEVPSTGTAGATIGSGMGGGFDCHSNAVDVEFIGCSVTSTQGWNNSIGATLRGRHNGVRDFDYRNVAVANTYGTAVELHGGDQWAHNVTMENGWFGVRVMDPYVGTTIYHKSRITGGYFKNLFGPAVWVATGHNDCHIVGIKECKDVGKGATASGGSAHDRSAIHLGGGTGHRVLGNNIPSGGGGGNTYSVDSTGLAITDMMVLGNYCTGYGIASIGPKTTNGGGSNYINDEFATRNYTDT